MNASTTRSLPDDPTLIHAYLDGELDPVDALEMERRISADPALAAECERIKALRSAMQANFPRQAPPAALRARIESQIGIGKAASAPSWRALAASIAIAALLASGSTWLALDRYRQDPVPAIVVAAHVRGLMAPSATDVTSSDTHTVKPWFSGRIPQAPRVIDLAGAGFPLAGGRIDVIGRAPSPTLVYTRRKHVISVIAVAAPGEADSAPTNIGADGYNIIRWTEGGVTYWAVSDLNSKELWEFVSQFRHA
jgi:anti-sigma factor RsiW